MGSIHADEQENTITGELHPWLVTCVRYALSGQWGIFI